MDLNSNSEQPNGVCGTFQTRVILDNGSMEAQRPYLNAIIAVSIIVAILWTGQVLHMSVAYGYINS